MTDKKDFEFKKEILFLLSMQLNHICGKKPCIFIFVTLFFFITTARFKKYGTIDPSLFLLNGQSSH
ncbi:hypothetical protein Pf1_00239 [Flavobacterium columnare]|nr:hypothetical protein Pf1_00239 [Flavobacterium columnare]